VVVKKLKDLEQTEIEAYFNRRVQRGGGGGYFATFLGGTKGEENELSRAQLDPRMLVWAYEGMCLGERSGGKCHARGDG